MDIDLIERPEAYRFDGQEMELLERMLRQSAQDTAFVPISSVNDVTLNPDTGRTIHGYKYTDESFVDACNKVAAGLYQLIMDLCGRWRKPSIDKRFYSRSYAIDTFNRLLKLRFERKLVTYQFVCNTKKKTIDGIVSPRYRYMSNSELYENIKNSFKSKPVKLHEVCLYGRQMLLRYKYDDHKTFYTIGDDIYHPGYHFGNSDVGGQALRVSVILIDKHGGCALAPYKGAAGARVIHMGRFFDRKLFTTLSNLNARIPTADFVTANGERLLEKNLNLSYSNYEKSLRTLAGQIKRKLPGGIAKRIALATAIFGKDAFTIIEDLMPEERQRMLESRTAYDLFVTLLREAKELSIVRREAVEQFAYQLLSGKFSL